MIKLGFTVSFIVALFFYGCKGTEGLKEGQKLYTGSDVEVAGDIKNKKKISSELNSLVKPKANKVILGMRPKVWLYHKTKDSKKGIGAWMHKKFSEAPVLANQTDPDRNVTIMNARLETHGYFNPAVTYDEVVKGKTISHLYKVDLSEPYTIGEYVMTDTASEVEKYIQRFVADDPLVRQGKVYELNDLKAERVRLDEKLKEEGFFYFNPDYILFRVDSTKGKKTVKIKVELKPEAPYEARYRYKINRVFIYPTFNYIDTAKFRDTTRTDGYYIINDDKSFRTSSLLKAVAFRPLSYYSLKDHNSTLRKLSGMGVFGYTSMRFRETVCEGDPGLDVFIFLTPVEKRSLRLELQASSKSNGFAGPGVTIGYRNRNLFRGAELLIVNLNGSFESQLRRGGSSYGSYEVGVEPKLYIPRLLVPFKIKKQSTRFVPQTRITTAASLLDRLQYFRMESFSGNFGYNFRETEHKEYLLDIVQLNFTRLTRTTPEFEKLLEELPVLRKSFSQQFILGGRYSFIYNTLDKGGQDHKFYFNPVMDMSGNIPSLLTGGGKRGIEEASLSFAGLSFSQYLRPEAEVRYYYDIDDRNRIATRAFFGYGIPYGNSRTLPYIKRYFAGGPNSVRGFPARSIGPGSYVSTDETGALYFDQSGDIKAEGNIEYRFFIWKVLRGAVFADAGNVWLYNGTAEFPGGTFSPANMFQQMAIAAGAGLRVDPGFFVLRLDAGFPLKDPAGNRYRGKESGRNVVLNIAVGYPF